MTSFAFWAVTLESDRKAGCGTHGAGPGTDLQGMWEQVWAAGKPGPGSEWVLASSFSFLTTTYTPADGNIFR